MRELERRITEALPDAAASADGEAETFVSSFESRKFVSCVQEQGLSVSSQQCLSIPSRMRHVIVYGEVTAEIAVTFYSQKARMDYTPLYVSFALNPFLQLADRAAWAKVEFDRCEAVEGPYLSNDVWLLKMTYLIFEIDDAHGWDRPRTGDISISRPEGDIV